MAASISFLLDPLREADSKWRVAAMTLQTGHRDSRDVDFFLRGFQRSGGSGKRKGNGKDANGTGIAGAEPPDRTKPSSYSRNRKT